MEKLTPKIEKVLEEIPQTRNSDVRLMIEIWRKYYPAYIMTGGSGAQAVLLQNLYSLPREDDIKRIRAHIQNDMGKFLPTDWKVAKQRRIKEEQWKEYMRQLNPKPDYL